MSHRMALGVYAGWHQVLPILGIDVKPSPMPMLVRCSHCGSPRMRIYDDTKFGGHWHYCPSCKSSGDMIELAARTWKCNLQQAVTRLIHAGVHLPEAADSDDSIASYERALGIQRRSRELLVQGAEALALNRVNTGYIIQQLGLLKDQDKPYWRKRMGRFMAGCTKIHAEGLTRPATAAAGLVKATGKFMGKGWGPLVAIPFWDLPGRYACYLFVGRQARPQVDYEVILLDDGRNNIEKTVDVGLCMYDVLDSQTAYHDTFGNAVVVFNDPIHALKLQSRHMRDSDLPLPLVATYNVKVKRKYNEAIQSTWELVTREVWRNRPDKKFVFWAAETATDVFNNAARADGSVYICKSPLVTSRNPPHIWLQIIMRQARPWAEVLEAELLSMEESTACDFLANLDFAPDVMQKFYQGCCEKLRQLLDRNRRQVRILNTAVINGKRICETPNGWMIEKTGEIISNVILRVDKIVSHEEEDDPYYVGRIMMGERQATFSVPYSKIASNTPGVWLHNRTIREIGKAPTIKKAWLAHVIDIAKQFHEPEVVREDGRFGWKRKDMCFALPQFTLHIGGELKVERAHVVDAHAPGIALNPPDFPPADMSKLSRDCLQNELFWAVTACLGANILAPAIGQPLANIGFNGHSSVGLGYSIARKAGCVVYESVGNLRNPHEYLDQLNAAMGRHAWPIIVKGTFTRDNNRAIERWLNSTSICNGVATFTGNTALLAPVLSPWRIVHIPAAVDMSSEAQLYGAMVIPLWLQRICKQKLELSSDSDTFVLQVLDDMAVMMEELGGNPETVLIASKHIADKSHDAARGESLVELLFRFITDGTARFGQFDDAVRDGYNPPKIVKIANDEHEGIFISNEDFYKLLAAYDLFTPSPGAITDALTNANALDCRCEYNGDNGWLIIERWWHQQIAKCRASQKRLTVIGGA